jgi:DNA-binding transcriptional LysR family regulator
MNWDDLRLFLAVARSASLSEAGRRLGVSQPTVSRRLAAMEARLGVTLIQRTEAGHGLTSVGQEILGSVEGVEEEIANIGRRVHGRDQSVAGTVTITCTQVMADSYLSSRLRPFVAENPGIMLNLVCTLQHLSLTRRDADVAVRMTSKPPEGLVGRRLCSIAVGVYGAKADSVASLDKAEWIGWQDDSYNRMLIAAKFPKAHIRHRTDDMQATAAMARAGLGLVVLPCYVGDLDPGLRRMVPEPADRHILDLWVLTHSNIRRAARVRALTEYIADQISSDRDLFEGRRPAAFAEGQTGLGSAG